MIKLFKNIIRKYWRGLQYSYNWPYEYLRKPGLYFSASIYFLSLTSLGVYETMALPGSSELRGLTRPFEQKVQPKSELNSNTPEKRDAIPNQKLEEYKFILKKFR